MSAMIRANILPVPVANVGISTAVHDARRVSPARFGPGSPKWLCARSTTKAAPRLFFRFQHLSFFLPLVKGEAL